MGLWDWILAFGIANRLEKMRSGKRKAQSDDWHSYSSGYSDGYSDREEEEFWNDEDDLFEEDNDEEW